MVYDEKLAARIRSALNGRARISEKKMFGGVAFLLQEKMFVGIVKDELMVRVGKERNDEALAKPHVRPMDFTGKPMAGYVFVAPRGCNTAAMLTGWIDWGAEFVATLPNKAKAKSKAAAKPRRARK